jgi:PhnB protein
MSKKPIIHAYLNFEGRCEEALEFYKKAIDAKVEMLMRHKESPEPAPPGCVPAGAENKVMHSSFFVGESMIMATDGRCTGTTSFAGFTISISAFTVAEADKFFNALAEGGQVQMPQTKTFFSPRFGMVTDKFGVNWMVIVPQEMPPK